jgi:hypothetical protein
VIKQLNLHELGGFRQPAREAVVRLARGRIAGRMIVHDDDGVGRGNDSGPKYVARMCDAFVDAPSRDFLDWVDSNQAITRIEQNNA